MKPFTPDMVLTKRKIILPLVFILVIISLLRVIKLTINSSSYSSPLLVHNIISFKPIRKETLTRKETKFLFDLVRQKSPCNLLVFGLEDEYLKLEIINGGGTTVFLEDGQEKIRKIKGIFNVTRVYKVEYKTYAKDAYKLLKYVRSNSSYDLPFGLPDEVLETKWDMIVVDGPCGDGPESPGRMGSIFMAGVLARAGNGTNVVVHDVDRMIEKWFSWEFLCEENRVSSKGRFWNFRIPKHIGNSSRRFCYA